MKEYIAHYFAVYLRTEEKQNLKNNLTQSCEYTCNLQIQLEILQSWKNNINPSNSYLEIWTEEIKLVKLTQTLRCIIYTTLNKHKSL